MTGYKIIILTSLLTTGTAGVDSGVNIRYVVSLRGKIILVSSRVLKMKFRIWTFLNWYHFLEYRKERAYLFNNYAILMFYLLCSISQGLKNNSPCYTRFTGLSVSFRGGFENSDKHSRYFCPEPGLACFITLGEASINKLYFSLIEI